MSPISASHPYNDPGSLLGGIRTRIAEILNVQADIFRSAAQSQSVVQDGRAFSGAQVTNDMTQTESLGQSAVAENSKNVTINDADPAAVPSGFNYNFLERVLTQVNAEDLLSRSILNLSQQQRVVQKGFSQGMDFEGNPSTVTNTLNQDAVVTNQDATSNVNTNTNALRDPAVEAAARFRETEVNVRGSLVEAGTYAVQDQGRSLEDASIQSARSDGGLTTNTLNQNASGSQNNNVFMQNTIDASVDGAEELTPRSSSTVVRIEGDVVRNYGSATQTQALIQVAEGGVDEFGNPTENGGQSMNTANLSASFADDSVASSTTSVLA